MNHRFETFDFSNDAQKSNSSGLHVAFSWAWQEQKDRERALNDLRDGYTKIICATDPWLQSKMIGRCTYLREGDC